MALVSIQKLDRTRRLLSRMGVSRKSRQELPLHDSKQEFKVEFLNHASASDRK
jgi:hypothetical protein